MPGAAFATGDRVTLRTVETEDATFIRDHSNAPAVRDPMTLSGPRNRDAVADHIDGDVDDGVQFLACVDGDDVGFDEAYVRRGDDAPADVDAVEPIGLVMLFHIDEREGTASFAYWLAPPAHGNGFGTEAAALALDYAFGHRRLHRVNARVLETNDPSIGLLETLGFEHEGTQREEKLVAGERIDTRCYGLLADEWERARESLEVPLDDRSV
ncbi:GNAT family N-acetyltransferase [Halorubellus sp. JP-L1]|uniref:GNAT family N-acetyltransferase n=1 Tax=Halorubellus sp. JP-L1 TaxID=2715753 RepID=UPI00140BD5EE|nr:GNAT family protein [Halorubellus sp. JP-L1]NHN43595.1 GNAT family N-acetyltransferase [Halorubellus sp. JP-L1]